MIKVKANFKNEYAGQIKCEWCKDEDETTQHIFKCKEYDDIYKEINVENSVEETLMRNNIEKTALITRKIMEKRKAKLEIKRFHRNQPTTAPPCTGSSPPDGGR